jgi:hypothetical protein
MAFEGYVEYQRREYCKVAKCPVQVLLDGETTGSPKHEQLRKICQSSCLETSHSFHKYLIDQGYVIVRPE